MITTFGSIEFRNFYSDFLLFFRSQTLVNCTSLDSFRCVVYFYNRLKVICATSKHLERDKCWQVGCRYDNLNRPVVNPFFLSSKLILSINSLFELIQVVSEVFWFQRFICSCFSWLLLQDFKMPSANTISILVTYVLQTLLPYTQGWQDSSVVECLPKD